MRSHSTLAEMLAATYDEDRHRGEERRHEHLRAMIEARGEHPSLVARLVAAARKLVQPDHSLTDYPCRLPDGRMGRVAVIKQDGDWAMVCRPA